MKLLHLRACGLLLALLLAPALAVAQTATTTLPRGIYEPSGRSQVQTAPVAMVTKDSVSGDWCIIGTSATCLMPGSGGGGGGSVAVDPFAPTGNASLSVTTTSARVALGSADDTTLVQNLGSVSACVNFGNSSVTSVLGSCTPVAPGMAIAFDANTATHVAALTSSGSTTLGVTTGTGIPAFGLALDNSTAVPVTDNGGSLTVDIGAGLPAGTNNIGDVDVLTLPAFPAGNNNIGDVDLASAIPAGANNIGDVDIASANFAVGQGNATLGQVGVLALCGNLSTTTTYTTGQSNPLICDLSGGLRVTPTNGAGVTAQFSNTNADTTPAVASGLSAQVVNSVGRLFDGTDFSRARTIAGTIGSSEGVTAVAEAPPTLRYISGATTDQVKSGAGYLYSVTVGTCVASATIDLIDNTTGSTVNLSRITCPATGGNPFTLNFNVAFTTGLRIITSGATDVTVGYR